MKIIVIALVLFISSSTAAVFAQPHRGFEISGHLDGLKDGEIVVLGNRFADWHRLTPMDSCKVSHGNFHLTGGSVGDGPRLFEVWFRNHRVLDKHEDQNIGGNFCTLMIDNGDSIKITGGDVNKMRGAEFSKEINVEGSLANFSKNSLTPVAYDYQHCYDIVARQLKKIADSVGFDKELVQGEINAKSAVDEGLAWVLLHAAPCYRPALPFIGCSVSDYHAAFVAALYKELDPVSRGSYYGRLLEASAKLCIGQPFPAFDLPTPEGKVVPLKQFVGKSKVTLVHFWASNSIFREKYQAELRVLYKKYHEKGLEVIAVSADSLADEWKTRVIVEKYPWPNVSDLKGNLKGGIVNDLYREGGHSVPNTTNVLLDSEGKIIAWDASGVELQYYLWKYLGE